MSDRGLPTGSLVQVEEDLPEQMKVRRAKRERLLASGVDPYPVGFPRTDTISELRAETGLEDLSGALWR